MNKVEEGITVRLYGEEETEARIYVETEEITVETKKVNKPYVGNYVNYVP